MRFPHFFIDRPIFASVVSIILTLVGVIALRALPITEFPEIAPPTIEVTATYAGAAADIVAETVASPIEQEINGVDNMIYMVSQSTGDGTTKIDVVFKPGTNIDDAQVLVQNRVSIASPRLPEEVQRVGVTVKKKSPDLMMVIHLISPDGALDQSYISNYATINIKDVLTRVDGVGDTIVFGARDYSMRIWLDPAKVQSRGLTASDVITALRGANIQVAAGAINQPPAKSPVGFEVAVQTLGRLSSPEQFSDIIVATDQDGGVTRVRDIARVELGAYTYTTNAYLDGKVATAIGIFQRPGSNALKTAAAVIATMDELAKNFPPGLGYRIAYNTTEFVQQSVDEVIRTLFEALVLVVLVIILFLQTWRAAIIPVVAIPVSLIGTFFVLEAFGFSLNNLTLFGLVLAIGIVVDDAIVVVENVERYLRQGLSPREAAHKTMDEVGGALIAIALVLCAVFIPSAFIAGISGAFYRQFALTIVSSTIISAIVSLTLSPALAALFLRPHGHEQKPGFWMTVGRPFNAFFAGFNRGFDKLSSGYAGLTRRVLRILALMLFVYAGLIGLTYFQFARTPSGFIPPLDRGYFITAITLPPGSSLERTDAVIRKASDLLLSRPGVAHTVTFAGFDGATFTNAPNSGVLFVTLKPFEERVKEKLKTETILNDLRAQVRALREAFVLVIPPPSVPGIGTGGGFKLYVQDRAGRGPRALERVVGAITGMANQTPGLVQVFTLFNAATPQVFADIDRTKAEILGVPISRFFDTLSTYMGSTYVNDFNILGRTYRVTAQADNPFRLSTRDVEALRTRSNASEMVPLGAVATFSNITGPYRVPRYNLFPAAEVQGATTPGFSTGQAIASMESILAKNLPSGFGFEWTEIALQEKVAGNTAVIAFSFAVVFVFLLLAAQYESVLLPLAVILIVPMCLLAAVSGVLLRGMDNNILTQIGFVVLIGLAAKNAILIVEFARQAEEGGASRWDAAVQAARTRLRPILMTSLAFILGVVPLVIATGAGAELRQALGTAVFFGMLGVTLFGLVFTPVFYVLVRWIASISFRRGTADTTQDPS
ncbi:Hydrophobe/amphiphile efflux-1 HAE1 [Nitrobacter hamburgensis X14]|uniref:Efflux pump membrane transporter n=1 Tax=Nitrobacter hamburgensis (strain DSM 10229 / NCIMB 13809 / X14) TaxID=323097 RepID=Q1QQA0_NITHX|nr:multidrug efflux RND transporter permease subunit [Nitrobacter hamburgensis]ABE61597.1 Hydrophobe/amphiphile efflux-1 HAE1 [Nitrobacter hamburgensis X14]